MYVTNLADSPVAGNLPADLTSFVGRRQLRSDLKRTLATARLVTLVGPGGVGKTRLALRGASEVRRLFPGGVWFVELGSLESPPLITGTIANSLGLRGPLSQYLSADLSTFFADRAALLVLDNCEHVIDECADLITRLLRSCHPLHILTTSRQALGCAGEHVLQVPPLAVPGEEDSTVAQSELTESVALFLDRARAVLPDFELNERNVGEVATICRYLEGIPLALELAAVRLRGLAPAQIALRLRDRFELLSSGPRGAPDRQRTLRKCVDWSYELCTPEEQNLWADMSVFTGGFEIDAITGIHPNASEIELVECVLSLVEKSIFVREDHSDQVRYRMLDVIREYGQQRLSEASGMAAVEHAHVTFYVELARCAQAGWLSSHQVQWLRRLHREQLNFRAALKHCVDTAEGAEVGMAMYTNLLTLWSAFGFIREGRTWLDRLLELAPAPTQLSLEALHVGVWLDSISGHHESSALLLDRAASVANYVHSEYAQYLLAQARGVHALYAGEAEKALAHFTEAARGFSELEDDFRLLQTLCPMGIACELSQAIERGMECHERVMEISERVGESYFRAFSLNTAGMLAFHMGDTDSAVRYVQESLQLKLDLDDGLGIAMCLESLALVTAPSSPNRAAILIGASRKAYASIGLPSNALPGRSERLDACISAMTNLLRPDEMGSALRTGSNFDQPSAIAFALNKPAPTSAPGQKRKTDESKLTRREREVAALIAEGLSNKDIGLRLVISQRTAESHVDHILTKLGFSSRVQISSWVHAHSTETGG